MQLIVLLWEKTDKEDQFFMFALLKKKNDRVENRFFILRYSFAFDVLKTAMASFGSHRLTL